MKRMFLIAMAAMAVILAGCSSNKTRTPNTFVDCNTLERAENIAGFRLNLPEKLPFSYKTRQYRALKGKMIEVVYKGDSEVCIRKGSGFKDISGDNTSYDYSKRLVLGGTSGQLRGTEKDSYHVATWKNPDTRYSYSITSEEGLTESDMVAMAYFIQ